MPEISQPEKHESLGSRILEIGARDRPFFHKFGFDSFRNFGITAPNRYIAIDGSGEVYNPKNDESSAFFESCSALRANGLHLPFRDESFDFVLLSDVFTYRVFPDENTYKSEDDYVNRRNGFYFLEDAKTVNSEVNNQQKLIDEIFRVLKQGGAMINADSYITLMPTAYLRLKKFLESDLRFEFNLIPYQSTRDGRPATVYKLRKKPALARV